MVGLPGRVILCSTGSFIVVEAPMLALNLLVDRPCEGGYLLLCGKQGLPLLIVGAVHARYVVVEGACDGIIYHLHLCVGVGGASNAVIVTEGCCRSVVSRGPYCVGPLSRRASYISVKWRLKLFHKLSVASNHSILQTMTTTNSPDVFTFSSLLPIDYF